MNRFADIDPMDIDPDTGRPYAGYSSPALDTSFHDAEMDVADWLSTRLRGTVSREQIVAAVRAGTHRPELPPVKPAAASLGGNLK